MKPVDEIRVQGELTKTNAALQAAQQEVEVLTELKSKLTVRAPLTGVVATFGIVQLLQNRPVRRGDMLFEIMDESGPWQLELEVKDYLIGHVLRAQQRLNYRTLPVEFIPGTSPELSFDGTIENISTTASVSETLGNVVGVIVSINTEDAEKLIRTIGAEVRAKSGCGKRSLGYVIFGDILDFIRRHLWW